MIVNKMIQINKWTSFITNKLVLMKGFFHLKQLYVVFFWVFSREKIFNQISIFIRKFGLSSLKTFDKFLF